MIHIKTKEQIKAMQEGGQILVKILKELTEKARPGVKTEDLDKLAHELVLSYGAKPSFLGYRNYPSSLCTSINDEIVHGLPSDRKLKDGDLLKIDFGVFYKGLHTDSAITVLISNLTEGEKKEKYADKIRLIDITREALNIGISKAIAGNTLNELGSAIQEFVERHNLNVVRDLVGHGIGEELHEPPQVANFGGLSSAEDKVLKEGMVIAIEPMVVVGDGRIKEDDQAFKTRDGSLAAHFEHTVAITDKRPFVLTMQ